MSRCSPQNKLLGNELSSSVREIKFSKQKFPAGIPISNIKYYHPGLQNNNFYYFFSDQLNYGLASYFTNSKTKKGNIDKFSLEPLMAPLIKKLFYQNADK